MAALRAGVERVVQAFLVGPPPETKLALLPHLPRLAAFAGRRDTADVLLPPLLTFFNSQSWQVRGVAWLGWGGAGDVGVRQAPAASSACGGPRGHAGRDRAQTMVGERRGPAALPHPPPPLATQPPQVRAAFYAGFAGVCPALGPEGVAAVVLPFLDRLVGDPEPAVAAEAAAFLAAAARGGLLRKRHLLAAAARVCARGMLAPAAPTPVRAAAVEFLAAAAGQLSVADVHAQLLPLVLPHLAAEPLSIQVGGGRGGPILTR